MEAWHMAALAFVTVGLAGATRGRVHPLAALLGCSTLFAALCGISTGGASKAFGTGFGQTATSAGLPLLAAACVATIAEQSGGTAALHAAAARLPRRGVSILLGVIGLLAGTGTSQAASLAVLRPLLAAAAGPDAPASPDAALRLGFSLNAAQACLLPAPPLIAGVVILGAGWPRVALTGLPLALLAAGLGAALSRFADTAEEPVAQPRCLPAHTAQGVAFSFACLVMAALMVVASLGDIPSEPLGGGAAREFVLAVGRPSIVFGAGVAIAVLTFRAWRNGGFGNNGWVPVAIARAAPLLLVASAAGGLQSMTQSVHMAEMIAERTLTVGAGLAVPFAAACLMKLLQGSTLVAAITAAGMIQPVMGALGLDDASGRALAALAVGAGAAAGVHVNDPFYWILADTARLRGPHALTLIGGGTLLQGLFLLGLLVLLRAAL